MKAIVQGTAINVILFLNCLRGPFGIEVRADGVDPLRTYISQPVMWAVAGVTIWSLVDYLRGNRQMLAKLDR